MYHKTRFANKYSINFQKNTILTLRPAECPAWTCPRLRFTFVTCKHQTTWDSSMDSTLGQPFPTFPASPCSKPRNPPKEKGFPKSSSWLGLWSCEGSWVVVFCFKILTKGTGMFFVKWFGHLNLGWAFFWKHAHSLKKKVWNLWKIVLLLKFQTSTAVPPRDTTLNKLHHVA